MIHQTAANPTSLPNKNGHQSRLLFFITISILLHGIIFSLLKIADKTSLTEYRLPLISITLVSARPTQIQSQPSDIYVNTNTPVPATPEEVENTTKAKNIYEEITSPVTSPLPSTSPPSAAQLIHQSRALIRSGNISPGEHPLNSVIVNNKNNQPSEIEAYHLNDGNMSIKIKSLFGGYQCFEAPHLPSNNDLIEIIWRHKRC